MKTLQEFLDWQKIKSSYDEIHALAKLFSNISQEVTANTDSAFRQIFSKDRRWLNATKDRLLKKDEDSSSALGELRAYGSLLMTSLQIKPNLTSTGADFIINKENVGSIYIEVATKLMSENSKQVIDDFKQNKINIKAIETAPYGLPDDQKSGDSISTNAISKICAIKQKEHQLSNELPSIIWVDLQDLCDNRNIFSEHSDCEPISSFNETITSGHIWYALYGWEGAPVMEQFNEVDSQIQRMAHDGRYRQPTKASAFIFSFPQGTVFLENPWTKNKLPVWFKNRLIYLCRFMLQRSLIDFEHLPLINHIEYLKKYIENIYSTFKLYIPNGEIS